MEDGTRSENWKISEVKESKSEIKLDINTRNLVTAKKVEMDKEFQEANFEDLINEADGVQKLKNPTKPQQKEHSSPPIQQLQSPQVHTTIEEAMNQEPVVPVSKIAPLSESPPPSAKSKNLKKRKPKKLTEAQKRKKQKEYQLNRMILQEKRERTENAIKFVRHTTTMIRFDPSRLGIKFLDSAKQIQEFGERKLSNVDLGKIQMKFKDTLSVTDMLREFMEEINFEKYAKPIAGKLTPGIVPSKSDIEATLKCLRMAQDSLGRGQGLSSEELAIAVEGVHCWTVFYKFLNGLDQAKLFALKGDLVGSTSGNRKEPDQSRLERLTFDIRRVVYLFAHLQPEMDSYFKKQSLEAIGSLLKTIISRNIDNMRYFRLFSEYYADLVDRLNLIDDCREVLESVNLEIFKKTILSSLKKYALEESQPDPYVIRLDRFLTKNKFKITARYWGHFVQSVVRHLEINHKNFIDRLCDNTDSLLKWVKGATEIQETTLERSFFLAGVKLAFTKILVDDVVSKQEAARLDKMLLKLSENKEYLPIFIAFYQAISQRLPAVEEQKALGMVSLDRFIARYIYKSPEDEYVERKIKVPQSSKLDDVKTMLIEKLTGKNPNSAVNEIIRIITNPKEIKIDTSSKNDNEQNWDSGYQLNPTFETLPQPFETYLVWINLINEIYLAYSLQTKPEMITYLRTSLEAKKQELESKLPKEDRLFLLALCSNFPDYPILSMNPTMTEHEVKLRVSIIHIMVQDLLVTHDNELLGRSTRGPKTLHLRDQLCAYPGEEEEKLKVIAQMVYAREILKWNTFDINSLNKCPQCNYYYFIGNCGKPTQVSNCPECKIQIGGQNHNYVGEKSHQVSNKDFLIEYSKLEKMAARRYIVRDLDKFDNSITMRFISGALNFKVIELLTHVRYMLEFIVAEKKCKDGLRKLLTLPEAKLPEYLFVVVGACFKEVVFHLKSEKRAFQWLNVLTWNIQLSNTALSFNKAKRNFFELAISRKIDYFMDHSAAVLFKLSKQRGGQKEGQMQRLIANWINETATVKDFTEVFTEIDLRLITALRSNLIEIDPTLDLVAQARKVMDNSHPEPAEYPLTKYVLSHAELLKEFPGIVEAHVNLSNHLMKTLAGMLGWKDACKVSIGELTRPNFGSFFGDEDLAEKVVEKIAPDETLRKLFESFVEKYRLMMQLRDKFPESLDFRFMCHATNQTEAMVAELTDPNRAKVAYFLVSETKPESVVIMSIFQTLAKLQETLVTKHAVLYAKVNGNKPLKSVLQNSKKEDYLSLTTPLEDLISKSVLYNKTTKQIDFNLPLLERELSESLFLGKPILDFQDKSIHNYPLYLDFTFTNNTITRISQKVNFEPLSLELHDYLNTAPPETFRELFRGLQLSLKELVDNNLAGVNATKLITVSPEVGLPLSQIKDLYLVLEDKLFGDGVKYLDPLFRQEPSVSALGACMRVHPGIVQGLKRLILRQLVGSDSEKLAELNLREALEYSGVIEPELPEKEFRAIDDGVSTGQAYALLLHMLDG